MKKNGFTLVELLAVITLLGVVTLLIWPSINKLSESNNNKQFENYEKLMIESVKTIPNYINKTCIDLNELKINSFNYSCEGYVTISNNNLTSYLKCFGNDQNNQELKYISENYNDLRCNSSN